MPGNAAVKLTMRTVDALSTINLDALYSVVCRTAPPGNYLTSVDVSRVGTFPTTSQRLTQSQFKKIQRHGFEFADATFMTRLASSLAHRKIVQ